MLPKAHLTSHYRMSGCRWVTTLGLSGSLRPFSYSSSVHSCHLLLISSVSVKSIPSLSFIVPIFVWNLPKEIKDLYANNYKMKLMMKLLMKVIKGNINRWRDIPCSWIGRINIVKMTIIPKAIYQYNAISIKLPRASLVAQMVKNLPVMQETQEMRVWSLVWEDGLEEEMATHSSILAWEIPWTEEPGGL